MFIIYLSMTLPSYLTFDQIKNRITIGICSTVVKPQHIYMFTLVEEILREVEFSDYFQAFKGKTRIQKLVLYEKTLDEESEEAVENVIKYMVDHP